MTEPEEPVAAPDPRLSVVVLAGGLSHERDVSLRSGRRVAEALRTRGLTVSVRDLDANLLPFLADEQPDVVWPLVHGSTGEDGSIQGLLEQLQIPFVGTEAAGCRTASLKPVAKHILSRVGVATPDFVTFSQGLFTELGASEILDSTVAGLGLPLVVKPVDGGSALGVTLVADRDELPAAMVDSFVYGSTALIEQAVQGTEVAVSVVDLGDGPRALPPVEIVTDGSYDYDARYNAGRTEYFVPARLSAQVHEAVSRTAVDVHTSLGLRDISRTDLIVDSDGVPWFIDINVAPGMTETSLFPQAAAAAERSGGLPVAELYAAIVGAAARRGARH